MRLCSYNFAFCNSVRPTLGHRSVVLAGVAGGCFKAASDRPILWLLSILRIKMVYGPYREYQLKHPCAWAKRLAGNYLKFGVVAVRLLRNVEDSRFRRRYWQQLARVLFNRAFEPHILFIYTVKVAMHYHFYALANALAQRDETGAIPNAGRSFSRKKSKVIEVALAS